MHSVKTFLTAGSLLLILILCYAFAPPLKTRVVKGDKIYFNRNVITYVPAVPGASLTDTTYDQVTGNMRITHKVSNPYVTMINNKPIIGEPDEYPKLKNGSEISGYVFDQLNTLLGQLDSGRYSLEIAYLVVDGKGRVGYYECEGIMPVDFNAPTSWYKQSPITRNSLEVIDDSQPNNRPWGKTTNSVSDAIQKKILSELEDLLLKRIQLVPATKESVPVACRYDLYIRFEIKDHIAVRH